MDKKIYFISLILMYFVGFLFFVNLYDNKSVFESFLLFWMSILLFLVSKLNFLKGE